MANRLIIEKFLNYSEDARLDETKLKSKYGTPLTFIENKSTDTQGFILEKNIYGKNFLIISFRGTQQSQDWLTDFNAWHTEIPYGNTSSKIKVHQGFLKCYKSVREEILQYIQKHKDKFTRIYITGHSLGGALSVLCAVDIQYNNPNLNLIVYTSGAPAVGNKAFARSYNKRVADTTRTYAKRDIVPKLPPWWFCKRLRGGYRHVEKSNPIGPNGFWAGFKYFFKLKLDFAGCLTNHSIELYKKWC